MEYTITNIKDLCELLTSDNCQRLFEDLSLFLGTIVMLKQEPGFEIPTDFTWVDDGKHDITLQFEDNKNMTLRFEQENL